VKDSIAYESSNRTVAVYKGLKVAVYTVDKTEISLARRDLVELINVCTSLLSYVFTESCLHSFIMSISDRRLEYTAVVNTAFTHK